MNRIRGAGSWIDQCAPPSAVAAIAGRAWTPSLALGLWLVTHQWFRVEDLHGDEVANRPHVLGAGKDGTRRTGDAIHEGVGIEVVGGRVVGSRLTEGNRDQRGRAEDSRLEDRHRRRLKPGRP